MRKLGRLRLAVAASAVVLAGGMIFGAGREEASVRRDAASPPSGGVTPALAPSPDLSAEEVVRYQVAALGSSGPYETRIRQCYRFASPLNRAATGPLGRFIRMVRSPPYDVMLETAETLVGRAVVRQDRATVLVTMIDPGRNIRVFRFFLSKQRESPYAGCWMTDAVREDVFERPAPPPESASAPAVGV